MKTPNLDRLAAAGTLFENAYCNSPLCSPARFALITGCRASRIGAYDNAAELPSGIPTLPHYLRAAGYRTCLSGKMDFTGADQLHGYGAPDHGSRAGRISAGSRIGPIPDAGAALVSYAAERRRGRPSRLQPSPCNTTKTPSSRPGNGCIKRPEMPIPVRSC